MNTATRSQFVMGPAQVNEVYKQNDDVRYAEAVDSPSIGPMASYYAFSSCRVKRRLRPISPGALILIKQTIYADYMNRVSRRSIPGRNSPGPILCHCQRA